MISQSLANPADVMMASSEGSARRAAGDLRSAAVNGNHDSIREAAEKFEGQFISQMLTHMFKDLKTDGLFGGGQAEGIWRDIYVDNVGKAIARNGGIGVAEVIERELLQLQEVSNGSA